MTTVGKILVVLHLVLSVMFMAFAAAVYTSQTNWRKAHATAASSLASSEKKNASVRQEMDTLLTEFKNKTTTLDAAIVTLKGQKANLETENKTLASDNRQLRKDVNQLEDLGKLAANEATEKKSEATVQRTVNSELFSTREDVIAKLKDTEDKRFELEVQLQQVSEKYDALLGDFKTMRSYLASKDLPTDPKELLVQRVPPPPLNGRVLDVKKAEKGSREYLETSLGSDSGLVVGHKVTVYNGEKFLGEVQLTIVEPDKSVGYVIKKAKNAVFHKNDEVTTKF